MFFQQGSYILLVTSTWQHGKQNGHNSLRFWGERKCQCQLRRRTRGVNSRAFFLRWNSTNVVWWINGLKEAIGLSMFFSKYWYKSWGWKHGAILSPMDKTVAATQICFSLSPRALGKWWRAYFSKCFYNFKHGWNFSYMAVDQAFRTIRDLEDQFSLGVVVVFLSVLKQGSLNGTHVGVIKQ